MMFIPESNRNFTPISNFEETMPLPGAELGFSDRGCKFLVNCISTNVKPPFSWFQVKSFQKTAGANAPALTPPLNNKID